MPITEILKIKNVFNIEKSNNNMLKLISEFTDICNKINENDNESIYMMLCQFYLNDIISKYQDDKEIIFNFEKSSTDLIFNSENTDIQQYFKKLLDDIDSHDAIVISRFYYLLSDIVEIYGIDNIEQIFSEEKQLKMTR